MRSVIRLLAVASSAKVLPQPQELTV